MASRRPADWRFPNEKQARAEETLRRMQRAGDPAPSPPAGPADPMPSEYWDAVLRDPRAQDTGPRRPLTTQRLADIRQNVLRVECLKCFRIVEIQTADATRLYGGQAVWKDVGMALLDGGCQSRSGNRDSDGCWPDFTV